MTAFDLDSAPLVVPAITEAVPRGIVRDAIQQGADAIELRIDRFPSPDLDTLVAYAASLAPVPLLATIRIANEGGGWTGTDADRSSWFQALLPHVAAIDIELHAADSLHPIIQKAQHHNRTVVLSFHDFEATPNVDTLLEKAHYASTFGASVFKVAAHCRDERDRQTLARFLTEAHTLPLAVIGMGPFGAASRVLFPALGSKLVYTHLGEATAPGQLTLRATLDYLRNLGIRSR